MVALAVEAFDHADKTMRVLIPSSLLALLAPLASRGPHKSWPTTRSTSNSPVRATRASRLSGTPSSCNALRLATGSPERAMPSALSTASHEPPKISARAPSLSASASSAALSSVVRWPEVTMATLRAPARAFSAAAMASLKIASAPVIRPSVRRLMPRSL